MRGLLWAGAGGAVVGTAGAQALDAPHLEASEPRAYGYRVGDVVQRQITLHAPHGWRLIEDSLPRPGARGGAIELRSVALQTHNVAGGQRHELALEYQVFFAPRELRTLEIAPLRLRLTHPSRSEELRVEAWPVTVAPLTPAEVSPRRGLGELQPDREPPLIDTDARRTRLAVSTALAALLLLAVAALSVGPAWLTARHRPFHRAWRELRHLPREPDTRQWQAACRAMHRALNASAAEVLFEPGVDRFIAAHPSFRGERDAIQRFLRMSRGEFFGNARHAPDDPAWLVGLCWRCRDAERGLPCP
jgi:mxaA protein